MVKRWKELAWRLFPGSLIALMFGAMGQLGLLKPAEQLAYNYLFQVRGAMPWDDRVVVIAIDDHSIQQLGRYPWPRRQFTQLMRQLNSTPPSVVVFDVIFSERSPDDAAFAAAIEQHGRVVLAQASDIHNQPLLPVSALHAAAIGVGHIYQWVDGDGITRSIPLERDQLKGLSLQAVQTHGISAPIPSLDHPPEKLWLNWPGAAKQMRQYSFVDVLNGQVPAAALRDKIVFVGITATGFDTLSTPFDRNPPVTGVYLHATAAHNLLQQNYLQPLNRLWLDWSFLAIIPGFGLLLSYWRTEWQLLSMVVCIGVVVGSAVVLLRVNYWLPVVLPIGLVGSTTVLVALTERLRMNHFLQTQVRHLWQTYPTALLPSVALAGWSQRRLRVSMPSSQPASIRVMTQLTAIAEQLGKDQATQSAIARNLSVGILTADHQGKVWFVNPIASHWLQIELGQSLADCVSQGWLSAADWQALMTLTQTLPALNAEATDADWQFEREVLQNDRWFWLKFEPLSLAESTLYNQPAHNLLLLLEDITTRKQLEENLAKQNQELQWLSQLKDDFIGTISHELRSPVTNMLLAIELMKTTADPAQHQKYLQQLEMECLRERDFINDLLRLQTQNLPDTSIVHQLIELKTWLPEIVFPFQARAATRQQTIELQLPDRLRAISTSPMSLERILKELLTNACKYTPSAQVIHLHVSQSAVATEIAVQNFGSEIPPDELPRIFEKFYRIPKTDPWKQGGTGLGLAIVKRLTEQMGATIAVVSRDGYTQFTICLPG